MLRTCPTSTGPNCMSFNPHPALRPDAAQRIVGGQQRSTVSILIRPFDRMLRLRALSTPLFSLVSILIRPFDRMLQGKRGICVKPHDCFNPHPALRPDAARNQGRIRGARMLFQSSSGPSTGCCGCPAGLLDGMEGFQSSSGPSTGCCLRAQASRWPASIRFNPHPALRPDAAPPGIRCPPRASSFNPHPALRPDAAAVERQLLGDVDPFQSSSGPSTGCCGDAGHFPDRQVLVSILIRPFDRMLHPRLAGNRAGRQNVSILIRPFDRMLREKM